jgi:pyruvate formate lyase activating enzyme
MKIGGLQKFTVIDYPEKIACVLFLYGCNFRCGFCHNPELVVDVFKERFSERDVLEFLEKRKGQLEGICITGGEPLFNLDKEFLIKVRKMGYMIKLDTNGTFPDKLKEIIDLDLVDYIAMDLKGAKDQYASIANVKVDMEKIERSIKMIVDSGKDYEFRTTIVGGVHTPEEVLKMAKWINEIAGKKPERFYLQGFKNKGKLLENMYKMKKDVLESYLKDLKKIVDNYFEGVEIRV